MEAQTPPVAETEEYTLKVRRFKPESGEGPYWEEFDVELDPTLSVLDGLLQAKDRDDGSLSVRCTAPRAAAPSTAPTSRSETTTTGSSTSRSPRTVKGRRSGTPR